MTDASEGIASEASTVATSPAAHVGRFEIPFDLAARLTSVEIPVPDAGALRPAAVMALLLPGDAKTPGDGTRLLLIQRSTMVRSHAGQLAFPGGKPEPEDGTLLATALREAEEEVGLPAHAARVLGRLEPVPTPTGFFITAFVAWARADWLPRISSPEVSRLLTPSFDELADPAVHRIVGVRTWGGRDYDLHEFAIATPPLWGATARMVWDLLERMRD